MESCFCKDSIEQWLQLHPSSAAYRHRVAWQKYSLQCFLEQQSKVFCLKGQSLPHVTMARKEWRKHKGKCRSATTQCLPWKHSGEGLFPIHPLYKKSLSSCPLLSATLERKCVSWISEFVRIMFNGDLKTNLKWNSQGWLQLLFLRLELFAASLPGGLSTYCLLMAT